MASSPLSAPHATRQIDQIVLAEVILLGGTATLLVIKWLRDQLSFYIHPRYTALVLVAALILLLMAAARSLAILSEQPRQRLSWGYLLLAVPLLLGTLVPARPLGADALAARGLDLQSAAATARSAATGDPAQWNLLEWATALSVRGEELEGQPVDLIGFVYQDPELGSDAFYVVRYVVTCCSADGAGAGLPVRWAGGEALPNDGWVRVRGAISVAGDGAIEQPTIRATSVEPVDQPSNPYLYP